MAYKRDSGDNIGWLHKQRYYAAKQIVDHKYMHEGMQVACMHLYSYVFKCTRVLHFNNSTAQSLRLKNVLAC